MSVRGASVSAAVAVVFSLLVVMSGGGADGAGGAEAAPFLGTALLSSLLSNSLLTGVNNGTSLLASLAQLHLQHKLDALAQLAQVFALTGNATENLFLN